MPQPSTSTGRLVTRVRAGGGTIPVEGALVTISKDGAVFAVTVSDESGNTEIIEIPTPPKSASLTPGVPGVPGLPYSTVFIEVDKDGYYSGQYIEVPIFPEILTVQPVNLLPLPEFFAGDTSESTQYFDESEGYDL